KGDAVRKGFEAARGDVLMILDADLTVPPEDLPRFFDAIASGKAEFVNGTRLVYPMEERAMKFANYLGNKLFSSLFTWLLGQRIRDTLCGTKALRREDYARISAGRASFGDFDPFGDFDLLFGAARLGLRIVDVPVRYRRRRAGVSKVRVVRHGLLLLAMSAFAFRRFTLARRRMFARHLDRIERLLPAGRVLDVGCATGDFLMSARARGWDPIGVDPSPAAAQARAAGLPIRGKTIQDADVRPHSVDLVTFWDVLEHLPDPVADLRRAGTLLGPGGMVALTVPDAGGAVARLSGRRWFGYKTAGEHLQFFTGSTLSRVLRAAGFDLVQR